MPFDVSWSNSKQVILLKVEGVLTLEDLQSLFVEAAAMMNETSDLVHFLVDTRTLQKIDNIPATLKIVQGEPRHPRMGWMIVVGKMNPMIKFGMDFVGLLTKSRYHCVNTMPEALAFLKEIGVDISGPVATV
jgi:hypothetical protein